MTACLINNNNRPNYNGAYIVPLVPRMRVAELQVTCETTEIVDSDWALMNIR